MTYRKNSLNGTYMSYFYTFSGKHLENFAPLSDFATDAQNGTLPQVAMIEPDSGHDEHPLDQIDVGARFVRDQVVALMNSPSWQDSIFIMVFDEGGGMYDHVPPASMPPPDNKKPILGPGDPRGLFDTTGFRVPNLVISPFTKPGYVSHTNADFTAILKLIETRFLTPDPTTGVLPSLTARDAAQPDLTEFFDWTSPNLNSTNPPEQTGLPLLLLPAVIGGHVPESPVQSGRALLLEKITERRPFADPLRPSRVCEFRLIDKSNRRSVPFVFRAAGCLLVRRPSLFNRTENRRAPALHLRGLRSASRTVLVLRIRTRSRCSRRFVVAHFGPFSPHYS